MSDRGYQLALTHLSANSSRMSFRAFMAVLLQKTGVFEYGPTPGETREEFEGRRKLGVWLMAFLDEDDPGLVGEIRKLSITMNKEQKDDEPDAPPL